MQEARFYTAINSSFLIMHIEINPKEFLPLFKLVASAAASTRNSPILSKVKIVVSEKYVTLHATDSIMGVSARMKCAVMVTGEALIPVKYFTEIMSEIKVGTVKLLGQQKGKEFRFLILHGEKEYWMPSEDPSELPDVKHIDAKQYHSAVTEDFLRALDRTIFVPDPKHMNETHTGVAFKIEENTLSLRGGSWLRRCFAGIVLPAE